MAVMLVSHVRAADAERPAARGPREGHGRRHAAAAAAGVLAASVACVWVLLAASPRRGELLTQVAVPEAFDVRWGFAECRGFRPINRVGGWGSTCKPSYAMLVSAMLSARACRTTRMTLNPLLSAQSIMDCYLDGDGCAAGTVEGALATLAAKPAVDETCMPLKAREGLGYVALPGKCETDTCHGSTGYYLEPNSRGNATAPFSSDARVVSGGADGAFVYKSGVEIAVPQSVEPLQRAILAGGPVLGKMNYYKTSTVGIRTDPLAEPISTFTDSIPAIYEGPGNVADDEAPDAVHDVLVLGWGRSNSGKPYWLVMDTIGECYGERGVFKIAMGVNAGNFEGYGFTFADLDVARAVQDTAVKTFMGGCSHDIEVYGDCRHSGILSTNGCHCKCDPRWTGDRCETCNLQCSNGGIINNFNVMSGGRSVETCRCDCPAGFAGLQCEEMCPNIKPFHY